MITLAIAAALMAIDAELAYAEIYKSVDKAGHVTYSNAPLPDAVTTAKLDPPDQPLEEDVRAAQEENKRIEALGAELEKRRLRREEQQARRQEIEERLWQTNQQQSPAPVYDISLPVATSSDPIFSGADRKHPRPFNKSPRKQDGMKHKHSARNDISIGMHPGMHPSPPPHRGQPGKPR